MAHLLRYLEERSVTAKQTYRLRINLDEGRVTVSQPTPSGEDRLPDDPYLQRQPLIAGIRISDLTTDQQGRLTSGETVLLYGPGGRSEALLLHLAAPGGAQFTIQSLPVNATVKTAAGYQENIP